MLFFKRIFVVGVLKNFMKPQALYIHIPFCSHKCLFCSFVIAIAQTHRIEDYLNRLEKEAKSHQGARLESVYIGGGTPSMLSFEQLKRLMTIIRTQYILSDDCELTMEANPEGIDEVKAAVIKSLGINRISLGVQSLDDRYLKFLGRKHDAARAVAAYNILRQTGFENINLDLMYAFPSQTREELKRDVRAIASLRSEHLSLYTLTIEPNSRFHASAMKLDDEETIAEGYLDVISILREYGIHQYEISNFSKKGFQSRHNQNYWLGGRYIGLGMGAHGFVGHRRYWNTSKLQDYLNQEEVIEGFEDLSEETLIMERVLFGLRMNEGIELQILPSSKKGIVEGFLKEGFLVLEGPRLKATNKGRLVLDELSARLI
ncbi:MAG: radical SAM family heme chaperone HemW [Candidatus Omnitrophica bacterium]|nr:radical SAM family heme chaperone HemW [Candidatus Omnitrophota bacterium]